MCEQSLIYVNMRDVFTKLEDILIICGELAGLWLAIEV